MASPRFIETEALLRAMEDAEVDSGNTELTLSYLREHFTPSELGRLDDAVGVLSECITDLWRERRG